MCIHFHISLHRRTFIDKVLCVFTEGCHINITLILLVRWDKNWSVDFINSVSQKCIVLDRGIVCQVCTYLSSVFLSTGTKRSLWVFWPSRWTSEYFAATLWHLSWTAGSVELFVSSLIKPCISCAHLLGPLAMKSQFVHRMLLTRWLYVYALLSN